MPKEIDNETLEPLANQTQFAVEEASREIPVAVVSSAPTAAPIANPQNRKLIILIGIAAVLGFLTLAVLFIKPQQTMITVLQPSPSPVTNATANPELEKRINELQADLQEADPARNDFTFPLVDMRLQLDKDR